MKQSCGEMIWESVCRLQKKNMRNRVFVVHGRDLKTARWVKRVLREVGLKEFSFQDAIKHTGEPNPYVLDILKVAFEHASAVIVVLTGDDKVKLRRVFQQDNDPEMESRLFPQARPNVLLEAGMALAFHEERTVLLQFGDVKFPSDIKGMHILEMDNTSTNSLRKSHKQFLDRLRNAGCHVIEKKPLRLPPLPSFQIDSYSEPWKVKTFGNRNIEVRELPKATGTEDQLILDWDVFYEAIEFLHKQLSAHHSGRFDMYVGIRHVGLCMAATIAGMCMDHAIPIGYIWPREIKRHVVDESCAWIPCDLANVETILICDQELKSGKSLNNTVGFLKRKYPNAEIKSAILCAKINKKGSRIENVKDLSSSKGYKKGIVDYPDFLAFVCRSRMKLTDHWFN